MSESSSSSSAAGSVPSPVPSPPPSPSAQRLSKRQRVVRAQETLDEVKTSLRDQDYRNIAEGLLVNHAEADKKLYVLTYMHMKVETRYDDDGEMEYRVVPQTRRTLLCLTTNDTLFIYGIIDRCDGYIRGTPLYDKWVNFVAAHGYASLPRPDVSDVLIPHADEGCGHGNRNVPIINAIVLCSLIYHFPQ